MNTETDNLMQIRKIQCCFRWVCFQCSGITLCRDTIILTETFSMKYILPRRVWSWTGTVLNVRSILYKAWLMAKIKLSIYNLNWRKKRPEAHLLSDQIPICVLPILQHSPNHRSFVYLRLASIFFSIDSILIIEFEKLLNIQSNTRLLCF